ncbi:enolase C-terminal domain-like protein [Dankookia sp. P2]|uniref:enolase C-terminal domain-like protein n=1 Tax=Dankookia sp. P2 TaxID=3423955 RepID=UPI003D666048
MRIASVRDGVVPIASAIANAYIDFSKMTASVVAVTVEDGAGRSATGYGFNSNGRYAQPGLLRERFIPRLLETPEAALVHADGGLEPAGAWAAMMRNEKPGGHGDRSVAVGVLDMALWDAAAKLQGKPLWRLLADRYRGGEADEAAWIYAAGGYYYPGKGLDELVAEMQRYLDLGYSVVKMKIGGAPGTPLRDALKLDVQRIEAVLKLLGGDGSRLCVDVNGRFGLHAALAYGAALAPYKLRWYEEPLDPLDYATHATLAEHYSAPIATGENLFSMLDCRNLIRHGGLRPDRDILQSRPGAVLRPRRVPADPGDARGARLVAAPLRSPWRAPVRAEHRGGPRPRRQRELPGGLRPLRRLRRCDAGAGQPHPHAGRAGHRFRAQGQSLGGAARPLGGTPAAGVSRLGGLVRSCFRNARSGPALQRLSPLGSAAPILSRLANAEDRCGRLTVRPAGKTVRRRMSCPAAIMPRTI